MKTIIVPTDFSPIAGNAMEFAVDMAMQIKASLLLLNVYQVPVTVSEVPVAIVSVDDLKKNSEEKLKELVREIEKKTAGQIKLYLEARQGVVVDELHDLCHTVQPFAVVMGATGAGALERTFFGSTTVMAMRHLHVPVLVIPAGVRFKPLHRIGLACDFKEVVSSTPDKGIKAFVKEFDAELHVLNVDFNNRHFRPETPEQSFLLHNMLADLNPQYHFINQESVEEGLSEFARNNNLDLLIVIPKKHRLLEGLFHKSHSRELAFHARVPVMAIHDE
jgi:nucleotide-binding universal stress UspA family protein